MREDTETKPTAVPTTQNFYIISATIPNYASIRERKRGSWVIQAFVEVLDMYYRYIDFDGLMRRVQDRLIIISEESSAKIFQTIETKKRGETRKFYISPCWAKLHTLQILCMWCFFLGLFGIILYVTMYPPAPL